MVYGTMIISSVFISYISCRIHKGEDGSLRQKRNQMQYVYFALSMLIPFFVSALRYNVGTDYNYTYVPRFYQYKESPFGALDWEPLFWLFFNGVAKITDNPQWVFVITSGVVMLGVWVASYEVSALPWMSILLFYISRHYFISMNAIRQYTGLAFVCIGMIFLKEKRVAPYIGFVIIGTLCHYSVALYLPLFVLMYIPLSPQLSVVLIGLLSVASKPIISIARWLVSFTPYSSYIGSAFDNAGRYNSWSLFEMIFVYVLTSFVVIDAPLRKEEHFLRFLYNIQTLCVFFSFNLNLIPIGERISWSLELPSIFLIPCILDRIKETKMKVLYMIPIVIVYCYVMYQRIFVYGDHEVYPYQAISILHVFLCNAFAT